MGRHNKREHVFSIRFGTHSVGVKATVIALDHKQAERMAKAYPNVKSVAKAKQHYDDITFRELVTFTEKIKLENVTPKLTALAMDEFIWLRRNKRVENRTKDKIES